MKTLSIFITSLSFVIGSFAFADLPEKYQTWTAVKKQEFLWEKKIKPSTWKKLPAVAGGGWASMLTNLRAAVTMNESFDHYKDEMPKSESGKVRPKIIHTWGTVAKVEFVAAKNSPYTGLFKSGGIGLARLSLAGNPDKIGYTPGMAVKFFIDLGYSVNLHVMASLDGQDKNHNFFAHAFTNKLPKPKKLILKTVEWFFKRFVDRPRHLGLEHMALRTTHGSVYLRPKGPEQIFFVPTPHAKISRNSKLDFRLELAKIKPDTHLYKVETTSMKNGVLQRLHLGDLYTRSEFIASQYGDKLLYFQHHE